jgi:hypothetical protein
MRGALVLLALMLTACGEDEKETGDDGGVTAEDMLADFETAMAGHTSWDQNAAFSGVQVSDSEQHGAFVQVWWNDVGAATITAAAGEATMPIGAIAVKEGYSDDAGTTLVSTVAMYKFDGYGWFYAEWDAAGAVVEYGSPTSCVDCHAFADKDEVFTATW